MYTYDWIILLYSRNWHNIVNKLYFFFFCLFRVTPGAYEGSQAMGQIGVVAADLHHSSQKHQSLNSLSKARDRTHDFMDTSWVH